MCISELSKVSMYEFHFDHVENEYRKKSRLLFIDTDGLLYKIETENVYDNLEIQNLNLKIFKNIRKIQIHYLLVK